MLRIHSETVCFFALAAAAIALKSSPLNRTGTILPFACPFGSFGLPTLLVFFKASKLLYDCGPNRSLWRSHRRDMQHCHMASRMLRVVSIVRPGIGFRCLRVA